MAFHRKTIFGYIATAGVVSVAVVAMLFTMRADESEVAVPMSVSLHGRQIFPPDDPWNMDISTEAIDENSDRLIASIGVDPSLHPDFGTVYRGAPLGIPYTVVSGDQPRIPITFQNASESDPGPYPIPADAMIEGGANSSGDRHVIILDKDNWRLYELYSASPEDAGRRWRADSGAVFDLQRNSVQRQPGWTSADAAGLPIFAGLVRYDEAVEQRKITHALRFTAKLTRRAYVHPATHFASRNTDAHLPPMGMRVRLKRDYDISGFPPSARVILQALKTYGMILADNGGNWFLSGSPDSRWNTDEIKTLKNVNGSAFEVIRMGQVVTTLDKTP